jgi:Ca2+-binding RTX toxin-like protein
MGISAAMLAATLAALLAVFVLAKPSQAQDTTVTVEPTEVNFGAVEVNSNPETRTISITNTGTDPLVITGVTFSDPAAGFSLVTDLGFDGLTVGLNETKFLEVSFDPVTEGVKQTTLTLNNLLGAIPGAPQVNITGTGVTTPNAAPDCTIVGTNNGETIRGTPGKDVICALGGNDKVKGGRGNDVVRSSKGNDVIRGDSGKDRLTDRAGRDQLNTKDGKRGDVASGGPQRDKIRKDKDDRGSRR